MKTVGPPSLRRQQVLTLLALALVTLYALWLRMPGLGSAGFASHDVAGITYNAQLLLAGDLPYRDSVELKAPGSFYLAAAIAPGEIAAGMREGATEIVGMGVAVRWVQRLHQLANLWALATILCVGGLAWRLFGRRAGVFAMALYALHDAHLDSMDANYVTWANLPALLALWLGIEARGIECDARDECDEVRGDARTPRQRLFLWGCAGMLAGIAALAKRPAAITGPVLLTMALWPALRAYEPTPELKARLAAAGALGLGVVVAHLPIALHYATQGALGDFVRGYALNEWGAAYVGARTPGLADAAREGLLASAHFVGLPLGLALIAFVGASRRFSIGEHKVAHGRLNRALGLWCVFMLAATAVGFRYYKGYFSTAAAPLCVLAAAPWGARAWWAKALQSGQGRAAVPVWFHRMAGLSLLAFIGLGAARQHDLNLRTRQDRAQPHDAGARSIVRMIQPDLEPGDRVWVWGWHLWDVYTYANARSGSRIYKSLGLLTPPNDDTWRRPATRPSFVDGPMATQLVEELRASKPRWIVLGSTAPSAKFTALRQLLRSDYQRMRKLRLGRVQFWRLRADKPPTD